MEVYYDLHIHSCLSPCGDKDMTPNNIAGMCKITDLNVIALTDHNACENCAALKKTTAKYNITFIPGMEITTSEEIHAVCLFPTVKKAMEFNTFVRSNQMKIENKEEIYGPQIIMNSNDEKIDTLKNLLLLATDISIMDLKTIVDNYNGTCFPAHIDRQSYSILSSLGGIPPECGFTTVEIEDKNKVKYLKEKHPILNSMRILHNSDAHYLENIKDKDSFLKVNTLTPENIIKLLNSKV